MTALTPEEIMATPAGDLTNLEGTELFGLRNRVSEILAAAKKLDEHLDRALEIKYGGQAHKLRLAQGKDTGVIHFDDGSVRITADLPKKIEWDQKHLSDIVRRIREGGEDPGEYVEIEYPVSETKFNAWPETLRRVFVPARTLKTGKPGFRLPPESTLFFDLEAGDLAVEGWHGTPARPRWRDKPHRARLIRSQDSCGSTLTMIAALLEPTVIAKILTHLGLSARAPLRSPARRLDLFQAA